MKSTIKTLLIAALGVGLLSSCSKDYLSPEVKDYITADHLKELAADPSVASDLVESNLTAIYNRIQTIPDNEINGDQCGFKGYQLRTDMFTEDIAYTGLQRDWFNWEYVYDNFHADWRWTADEWFMMYDVVSKCNIILRDYFAEEPKDDATKAIKAEPLALRGITFFNLVNFYQATYKGHEDAMGVPLTLTPEDDKLPRATVREVYEQIIKDLTYAVEYGAVTDKNTDADRAVAAAYLTKAYACMEDWANVEKYAKIAQEGHSDVVPKLPMGWSVNNADVLWGADVTPATSEMWWSFWSHMDPMIPFYCGHNQEKSMYNWLYEQMGKEDVRRTLYVNHIQYPEIAKAYGYEPHDVELGVFNDNGEPVMGPDGKQLTEKVFTNFDYTALKFVSPEGANTDYCYIRIQDPILMEIEAINEQGRTGEAAQKLAAFVTKRDPGFVAATDQSALRDQIRIQRRIELWGEGTTWLDFRRWDLMVDRSKPATLHDGSTLKSNHTFITDPISLNDIHYIHQLPQREVNNNKNLKQDPRP